MAENLHSRLTQLMETEKIYTESELSLSELANRLNTLPNYLSQVINDKEGKNFYDYINMLRIEEFKTLVSRPENRKYTLLSLSYDCGFNSKSSFNKNFKKVTGLSPSEYLNHLNMEVGRFLISNFHETGVIPHAATSRDSLYRLVYNAFNGFNLFSSTRCQLIR